MYVIFDICFLFINYSLTLDPIYYFHHLYSLRIEKRQFLDPSTQMRQKTTKTVMKYHQLQKPKTHKEMFVGTGLTEEKLKRKITQFMTRLAMWYSQVSEERAWVCSMDKCTSNLSFKKGFCNTCAKKAFNVTNEKKKVNVVDSVTGRRHMVDDISICWQDGGPQQVLRSTLLDIAQTPTQDGETVYFPTSLLCPPMECFKSPEERDDHLDYIIECRRLRSEKRAKDHQRKQEVKRKEHQMKTKENLAFSRALWDENKNSIPSPWELWISTTNIENSLDFADVKFNTMTHLCHCTSMPPDKELEASEVNAGSQVNILIPNMLLKKISDDKRRGETFRILRHLCYDYLKDYRVWFSGGGLLAAIEFFKRHWGLYYSFAAGQTYYVRVVFSSNERYAECNQFYYNGGVNPRHKQLVFFSPDTHTNPNPHIQYDMCAKFTITESTDFEEWKWKVLRVRDSTSQTIPKTMKAGEWTFDSPELFSESDGGIYWRPHP